MIQTLQSLRFIFIMLIVFSHIIGKSFDFGGECGVSFFFMLSGFVLSLAYGAKVTSNSFQTRSLLLRQLTKFYPLHILMLTAFVALDARLGRFYDWQHLLPNVFLLQSWIPYDEYYFVANGSSWFLCDIMFFYFVFSFAYRKLTLMRTTLLLLLGIVVLIIYVLLAYSIPLSSVNSILYASPLTRLIDFCLGIMLCRLYRSDFCAVFERHLKKSNTTTISFFEICLFAFLIISFFVYESMTQRLRCAALFWLVIPQLLLFFAISDKKGGFITRFLQHPLLLWFANISFEIYLTHMFVFRFINSILTSIGLSDEVIFASVGLIVLFPFAWLTKRFFVDKIRYMLFY